MYQKVSLLEPVGAVNVCAAVLSVVGAVEPSCAAYVPVCEAVVIEVVPVTVQPLNEPVSKPPLVIGFGGGGGGGVLAEIVTSSKSVYVGSLE